LKQSKHSAPTIAGANENGRQAIGPAWKVAISQQNDAVWHRHFQIAFNDHIMRLRWREFGELAE